MPKLILINSCCRIQNSKLSNYSNWFLIDICFSSLQLAGDWKNLRRAFKKLDKTNQGFLSVPEFRSVLKLANVILDEDEVYHVLNKFDHDMTGKISYEKFIEETFKPQTRHSVRPV